MRNRRTTEYFFISLFAIFSFLTLTNSALCAAPKPQAQLLAEKLMLDPEKSSPSDVPVDQRDEVIKVLRLYSIEKGPDSTLSSFISAVEAKIALVRLMDPEAIKQLFKGFDNEAATKGYVTGFFIFSGGDGIEKAAQPQLIPLFANYLPQEDGNKLSYEGSDCIITLYPKSIGSARIILGIIDKCPDFNTDTRKWAKKTYHLLDYGASNLVNYREVMVEWWNANKAAIEKGDYKSVKPGGEAIATMRSQQEVEEARRIYEQAAAKNGETARLAYVSKLAALLDGPMHDFVMNKRRDNTGGLDLIFAELLKHPAPANSDAKQLSELRTGTWQSTWRQNQFRDDGKWNILPVGNKAVFGHWEISSNRYTETYPGSIAAQPYEIQRTIILLDKSHFITSDGTTVYFETRSAK